jgi:hypothetical protein
MPVEMDSDVKNVSLFMQKNIRADKLSAVARALANLAPALWDRYVSEVSDPCFPLSLAPDRTAQS